MEAREDSGPGPRVGIHASWLGGSREPQKVLGKGRCQVFLQEAGSGVEEGLLGRLR